MTKTSELPDILTVVEFLTGDRYSPRSNSLVVCCPIHLERNPSCSIDVDRNIFHCFTCDIGGSVALLVRHSRFAQLSDKDGFAAAYKLLRNLSNETPDSKRDMPAPIEKERTPLVDVTRLTFTFVDRNGRPLYDEIRLEGYDRDILHAQLAAGATMEAARAAAKTKRPFQRRPLPKGRWYIEGDRFVYFDMGGKRVPYSDTDPEQVSLPRFNRRGDALREPHSNYLYSLRGLTSVLYRLPGVVHAATNGLPIALLEGPKKADIVTRRLGLTATSLAGGVNADFTLEHALDCNGAPGLLIFQDSDEVGQKCALTRAKIAAEVIPDVRIIDFYGDTSARDVANWIEERGRASADVLLDEVQALADKAVSILPGGGWEYRGPFPSLRKAA